MPNHSELCFPPLQNVEKVFGKTAALRCLSPDSSGKRQGDVGLGDFSGARQPSLNAGSSLGNAAGCSWTRNFTSLCLTFLIYKMGMMTIVPTSEGCCEGKQMSEYLRGVPCIWVAQLLLCNAVSVIVLDSWPGAEAWPFPDRGRHAVNACWLVGQVSGLCWGLACHGGRVVGQHAQPTL